MPLAGRGDVPDALELGPAHRREVEAPRVVVVVVAIRTAKDVDLVLVCHAGVASAPRRAGRCGAQQAPGGRVLETVEVKAPQLVEEGGVHLAAEHDQVGPDDRERVPVAPDGPRRVVHAAGPDPRPLAVVQVEQVECLVLRVLGADLGVAAPEDKHVGHQHRRVAHTGQRRLPAGLHERGIERDVCLDPAWPLDLHGLNAQHIHVVLHAVPDESTKDVHLAARPRRLVCRVAVAGERRRAQHAWRRVPLLVQEARRVHGDRLLAPWVNDVLPLPLLLLGGSGRVLRAQWRRAAGVNARVRCGCAAWRGCAALQHTASAAARRAWRAYRRPVDAGRCGGRAARGHRLAQLRHGRRAKRRVALGRGARRHAAGAGLRGVVRIALGAVVRHDARHDPGRPPGDEPAQRRVGLDRAGIAAAAGASVGGRPLWVRKHLMHAFALRRALLTKDGHACVPRGPPRGHLDPHLRLRRRGPCAEKGRTGNRNRRPASSVVGCRRRPRRACRHPIVII